jgi:CTP:molybdopterin cytidylyltransferase MocA
MPDVVYPCYIGKHGHPPLLSSRLSQAILDWRGLDGLRGLLYSFGPNSHDVEVLDPGIISNINTPEQYHSLYEKYRGCTL